MTTMGSAGIQLATLFGGIALVVGAVAASQLMRKRSRRTKALTVLASMRSSHRRRDINEDAAVTDVRAGEPE